MNLLCIDFVVESYSFFFVVFILGLGILLGFFGWGFFLLLNCNLLYLRNV